MPLKLHRCKYTWVRTELEACWRVQKALRDAGIAHEVVTHAKGDRDAVERLTGQRLFPAIEFEDGSPYRAESKEMAETIRTGRLDEKRGGASVTE